MKLNISIWHYPDQSLYPHEFADVAKCPYCSTPLQRLFWEQRKGKSHNEDYDDLEGFVCQTCGWWKVIQETGVWGPYSKTRRMSKFVYQKFCQAGCLKNLHTGKLTLPIEEVQSFLCGRDSSGASIHPGLYAETVARVFALQGYDLIVTSTSTEGGITAILAKGKESFGVQVKRSHDTIAVEQIRAITGAFVLTGVTKGAFVTTAPVQTDADPAARQLQAKGYSIEMVDAARFYDALRLTQCPQYRSKKDFLSTHDLNHMVRIKAYEGW